MQAVQQHRTRAFKCNGHSGFSAPAVVSVGGVVAGKVAAFKLSPSPALLNEGTECCAIRHSVQQGRFAPQRCAGKSVSGCAACRRRKKATAVHSTYSSAVCRTGKLSPPTVVLRQTQAASVTCRSAAAAVQGSHVHHLRTELRSNMALNRSANGKSPWPRSAYGASCTARPRRLAVVARLALR
jgi:hypothetical protein